MSVGTENAGKLLERGQVEVAPLAFMRGRAQPVDRRVLTPWGWRRIGELAVGDLVIGSNGRPTVVLGVYPRPVLDLINVSLTHLNQVVAGKAQVALATASSMVP